ncbi:hypothetical protein FQN54_005472 [Arachnomyces sp. PD_36]|nr:hypothetical protein FQN54_005472 [Arachnomyces sp. PD_36]
MAKMSREMENGILKDQTFGNRKGLDLLERLSTLEKSVEELRKDHEQETSELRQETSKLRDQVQVLKNSSEGYLEVRHRFLNVYRRDVMGDTSKSSDIRQANKRVHSADVVTDRQLYMEGRRDDRHVFERLYGLSPEKVSFLEENQNLRLLRAIDDMATKRAERVPGLEKVDSAFRKLVGLISTRKTAISNKRNNKSQVSRAYEKYRRQLRKWESD